MSCVALINRSRRADNRTSLRISRRFGIMATHIDGYLYTYITNTADYVFNRSAAEITRRIRSGTNSCEVIALNRGLLFADGIARGPHAN